MPVLLIGRTNTRDKSTEIITTLDFVMYFVLEFMCVSVPEW